MFWVYFLKITWIKLLKAEVWATPASWRLIQLIKIQCPDKLLFGGIQGCCGLKLEVFCLCPLLFTQQSSKILTATWHIAKPLGYSHPSKQTGWELQMCPLPPPRTFAHLELSWSAVEVSNRIEAGLPSTPVQHWHGIPWMESDLSRKGNERRNLQDYIPFMCPSLLDHRETNLSPEPPLKEMDSQKFWPGV